MILFQYLDDLPPVPNDIVSNILTNVRSQQIDHAVPHRNIDLKDRTVKNVVYNRHRATDELINWIRKNISINYESLGVQIQDPNPDNQRHFPHTDTSPRHWVLNYNIQPGGGNVITSWYQENGYPVLREGTTRPKDVDQLELIQSVCVEPFRWHLLNTQVLHGVENIEHSRIAVTVGFETNPIEDNLLV